jgi:hypothetical protein
MNRNVIALQVEARGLTNGLSLRLYRHTDTYGNRDCAA